jgi:hypothetical protein
VVHGEAWGARPRCWRAQSRPRLAAHLLQTATDDVERRREGRALSYIGWTEAVLYNSLGRYEEALAAAQRTSEDSPAVQFADWALVELVEACAGRELGYRF